jgi:trimethylamine--corrinoid protein Co-methyltransferase
MPSKTPDIIAIPRWSHQRPSLSPESLVKLQQATLTVLDDIGVHIPSQRAREIFGSHGARVGDDDVVRLDPDLVRAALAAAPRSFVLAGREERLDLVLDGANTYLTTEGVGVSVVDIGSSEPRASRKADVELMARIADALPLIAFYWPMVSAQDHGRAAPVHECHACLTNTAKHARGGTTMDPRLAAYVVEMATVVAGDTTELRRRPPICGITCPVAPLAHDPHGLECALLYASKGIPVGFAAMNSPGKDAPASWAAAVVQADAEVVSGMVLLQLAYPGAPVFHSLMISQMDPHSGGYLGEPPAPCEAIASQLAHAWGVPSLNGGYPGATDAIDLTWESGLTTGAGAAMIWTAAGEIGAYLGLTGGAMRLYPEYLVLQHEAYMQIACKFADLKVSEESLALDVLGDVGPRGFFLKHSHTRQHLRDFRLPLWLRQPGRQMSAREAAVEEFRRLEREHHPQVVPDDVRAELGRIVAAADRTAATLA